jgi:hypothetical protein
MVRLRYSREEISRLGDLIYDREIAPRTNAEEAGLFVAIDVDSGAYEIASDELAVTERLLERKPEAQIWLRRIGARYTHHLLGPRRRTGHRHGHD